MNYRHSFHAGNFADLVKHAALIRLVERLTTDGSPLTVVDTHAGAGLYDLSDPGQARSREAEAGVGRLMALDVPPLLSPLRDAVLRRNPDGRVRFYPGSPVLALETLRTADRYLACELQPDVYDALRRVLANASNASALQTDGFREAAKVAASPGRLLVVIDPPFERPDDYANCAGALAAVFARKPEAVALVWAPLKDLETLDGFVRRLEAADLPRAVIAETRLRPLHDPMRMNGCVLVAVAPPSGFEHDLESIGSFVAEALGDAGARAKVWTV